MNSNPSGNRSSEEHHTIKNADVPSKTGSLPGAGEEASAAHYLRDTVEPEDSKANAEKRPPFKP